MTKKIQEYQLRPLKAEDLQLALRLSNAEGWNQTAEDWKLMIMDPRNICMAVVKGDRLIATATAVNYNGEVAWIGMVLVDRDHRGQGLSKLLLFNLLERLKSLSSIKLDATPAGQAVYKKFNFKDEFLIHRLTAKSINGEGLTLQDGNAIVPMENHQLPEIVDLDASVFGMKRGPLIKYLWHSSPQTAFVIMRNGKVVGFSLGRKGTRFHQVGPVMAFSAQDAMQLILNCIKNLPGQPLVIDILATWHELQQRLETIGFVQQRYFVRMYRYKNPFPGTVKNHYLICGPEFG